MKRVLVTGLGGFIGRQCLPLLLEEGYEVIGCGRGDVFPEALEDERVSWYKLDLVEQGAAEKLVREVKPTHLLNLAWYTEPGKFSNSPKSLRWVEAGIGMLRSFIDIGGTRFVGAGSCAEYDWHYGHMSEQGTPLKPQTPFGSFKKSLYELSSTYAGLTGVSFAWGRVFFVYGPYEKQARLVPSVIMPLISGQEARCSPGKQIRDFSHVEDVAGSFVALLESDISGAVNIASGDPVPVKNIVNQIGKILGRSDLIRLGAIPMAEHDPPVLTANVQRLYNEVGYKNKYDLSRGLENTIEFFRKGL